jgi:crossover junction endonuclease MUS81
MSHASFSDQNSTILHIDNRETEIVSYFTRLNDIPFTTSNMPIGDVLITAPTTRTSVLVIERKTPKDLMQSIKDGRYKEQKFRLLQTYPKEQIMYLIEGQIPKQPEHESKIMWSAVINTLLRDNIKMWHTEDSQATCKFIMDVCMRVCTHPEKYLLNATDTDTSANVSTNQDTTASSRHIAYSQCLKPAAKKSFMTRDVFITSVLSVIPGISTTKALAIAKKYSTLPILVMTATLEDLASIKLPSGVSLGKKTAAKVLEYVKESQGSEDT